MISTRITRAVPCALGLLLAACAGPSPEENIASKQLADGEDDAYVIWHSLPHDMECGEERQVTVEMMNYGAIWEPGTHSLRAFQGPAPFVAPAQIDLDHAVDRGELYQFSFPLRAPSYAVTARSQWRMMGSGPFGEIAGDHPDPPIEVHCSTPQDRARVVGVEFPGSVECGETFDVRVTLENDGETTWSTAERYRLEANPANHVQGPARVDVGGNVYPEHTYDFDMTLTAPSTAGNFTNSWQMTSDAGGPFNDVFHRSVQVNCDNPEDRAAISDTIPPTTQCGGHFTFTVTVQNTGSTTWWSDPSGTRGYYLRLTDDSVPLGDLRYFFPHAIGPGQFHTFTITMHGPPTADTYYIAFEMFNRDRNDSFGPRAEQHLVSTCNWENARVVDHGLAPEVNCGEPYLIRVKMQNTGLWTWTHQGEYRLINVGNLLFHPWTPHIPLPPNVEIRPGSMYTFETWLTAPFTNGEYPQGWQMGSWTGGGFGQLLFGYVNVRCAPYASRATNVVMPTELQCGQIFAASIAYQNRGTEAWARDRGDKLGALGATDPFGPPEVPITGFPLVFPGESKTFSFNMIGPYAPPGEYPSDWSMFHNGVAFGEPVDRRIGLDCSPLDARLVSFASTDRGGCEPEVDMLVTVRNAGFKTWGAITTVIPDEFSFVQDTPLSPFALASSIQFPATFKIRPGETHTFPVRFRRAQPTVGIPPSSSWRMHIKRPWGNHRPDSPGEESFGPTIRIPVPRLAPYCH